MGRSGKGNDTSKITFGEDGEIEGSINSMGRLERREKKKRVPEGNWHERVTFFDEKKRGKPDDHPITRTKSRFLKSGKTIKRKQRHCLITGVKEKPETKTSSGAKKK